MGELANLKLQAYCLDNCHLFILWAILAWPYDYNHALGLV